jgi:regulator of protease activity HflC (stomatin/prohibitin superfamily)
MSGWTADEEIEQAITTHLTTVLGPKSARELVTGFRAKVRNEVLDAVERRLTHLHDKAGAR